MATKVRVLASSVRVSMAIAPCPTAGKNSSASRISVAADISPSRFSPAAASTVASTSPPSSLRRRVSTFPRSSVRETSGRSRLIMACRRGEAVPTRAPDGNSLNVLAFRLMNTSRASSRGKKPAMIRPAGKNVAKSFAEWTAISIAPASSASSISLVNRPLPPASASGRSTMISPVVRKILTSMRSGSRAATAANRPLTSCACASASGEPRDPRRKIEVSIEDLAIARL